MMIRQPQLSLLGPSTRALFAHKNHVRDALIALFETPVSVTNVMGRKVLNSILCNSSINFDKPMMLLILDFTNDCHLEP